MISFTFLERIKNVLSNSNNESSDASPESVPKELPRLQVKINDFVVVSVLAEKGPSKNFVAQVVDVLDDDFEISFLKKSYGKFFFPTTLDVSWVRLDEVIKVLKEPIINKRGQFIFSELKNSETKIF